MTEIRRNRTVTGKFTVLALALALGVTGGLAGCAPEPGDGPAPGAGAENEKGSTEAPDSWPEQATEEQTKKNVELPESFPKEQFPIPAGAAIDDTGERAAGQWFLVLRADSPEAAATLWDQVVSGGGFEVVDPAETGDGGRTATLAKQGVEVSALTLPQSDGSILLSYDIVAAAGSAGAAGSSGSEG